METIKLGQLITNGQHSRDAVHVAVAPVTATERLAPGDHVGLNIDGDAGRSSKSIGIVDPYLESPVYKGDRFWLFLYPGSITSLRHDWTHPEFERVNSEVETAKEAIKELCEPMGITFERMISAAEAFLKYGTYLSSGDLEGCYVGDDFWDNYETYTGTKVPRSQRYSFFSCSC